MAKGKYKQWRTQEGLAQIMAWARSGLTLAQIAHNCGIAPATLYEWQAAYPDIAEALKKSCEVADLVVENALYKRAIGYDYTENVTEENTKNGKTVKVILKHMAPDVGAICMWLKNRQPDRWRDRPKTKADQREQEARIAALERQAADGTQQSEIVVELRGEADAYGE